ncbi:hypothetical protein H271_10715 [Vibrio parahaemolyticus 1911C]|nr:hypothetical protein H271_10715 [Vibrio parahaemolyticus 1911C]
MIHLVSDCTHLTQCPKLLVQITLQSPEPFGKNPKLGKLLINALLYAY